MISSITVKEGDMVKKGQVLFRLRAADLALRIKQAEAALAKAEADDPETLFVRTMAALKQGDVERGLQLSAQALDAGLPWQRLVAGPRKVLAPLYGTSACINSWAICTSSALRSSRP